MLHAKEVKNSDGKQYHICCSKEDVGRYVFLPGDPFRTDKIAAYFDQPTLVAHNREHKTWSGFLDGVKVSVTSTGMGGPSAAIAVEELIHCGADTFLRVGTAGYINEEIKKQKVRGVIVTGAVRDEGTTIQYVPIEYPAIANREWVEALSSAAKMAGSSFIEGIVHCKDSFYGQIDPDSMPVAPRLKERWEAWKHANVLASEMETAALFVVSQVRNARAGAIMAYLTMDDETIHVAIEAMKRMIQKDRENIE